LLRRHGVVERDIGELLCRRVHGGRCLLERLDELLNARIGSGQPARARAARQRARLLGQRALQIG
jgi:hypothetical protein